jgi:kumamolisin
MDWMYGPDRLSPCPIDEATATELFWTIETIMDLETVGAFANGARIIAHFGKGATFPAALRQLWEVLCDESLDPSVVSGSFVLPEARLSQMDAMLLNDVLALFALRGVTVVFPAGDYGSISLQSVAGGQADAPVASTVMMPASSPYSLAVGGSRFWSDASGEISREVAFFCLLGAPVRQMASGGGFSAYYERPSWQRTALERWRSLVPASGAELVTRRGVPDVTINAHMLSGYPCLAGGVHGVAGGTACGTQLVASLLLRLNQRFGRRLGYLNPVLYEESVSRAFFDITDGTNDVSCDGGDFHATPGWDPVTGLGSIRGRALVEALERRLAQGNPTER